MLRDVMINYLDTDNEARDVLEALVRSPCLTRVILVEVSYVEGFFTRLPWDHLIHLEIHPGASLFGYPEHLTTTAHVLSKAPNLRTFGTTEYSWGRIISTSSNPIGANLSASGIVALEIHEWSYARAGRSTLSSLILPSLQHLILNVSDGSQHELDDVIKAVANSSCRLRSISLPEVALMEISVERLLCTSNSTLQKISLGGPILGHSLLECFMSKIGSSSSERLFPKLEELDVD
ncbi:hypothetical protein V5O48_018944 [Marasmius crinis-equi]|uniref:Uncharacterized protein n=1 Tax=Marasmius crinis-equi TaxID=585013 RepID=A0ABR3EJR9_9AGAR